MTKRKRRRKQGALPPSVLVTSHQIVTKFLKNVFRRGNRWYVLLTEGKEERLEIDSRNVEGVNQVAAPHAIEWGVGASSIVETGYLGIKDRQTRQLCLYFAIGIVKAGIVTIGLQIDHVIQLDDTQPIATVNKKPHTKIIPCYGCKGSKLFVTGEILKWKNNKRGTTHAAPPCTFINRKLRLLDHHLLTVLDINTLVQ